jgi:micrococcal nuclease
MRKIKPLFPFFLLLFVLTGTGFKATGLVKVIAISDGDTFTVLDGKNQIRIRLDAIDAPEKGMPYAKASKKFLSGLCFGKLVQLNPVTIDRYGRTVARVILTDGRDVSAEMIRAGYAWHYKKYSSDPILSKLEINARSAKAGLWRDNNAIAPWEIRKMHRNGISTKKLFEGALYK